MKFLIVATMLTLAPIAAFAQIASDPVVNLNSEYNGFQLQFQHLQGSMNDLALAYRQELQVVAKDEADKAELIQWLKDAQAKAQPAPPAPPPAQ